MLESSQHEYLSYERKIKHTEFGTGEVEYSFEIVHKNSTTAFTRNAALTIDGSNECVRFISRNFVREDLEEKLKENDFVIGYF